MSSIYFIQEAIKKVYADEFQINALPVDVVYDGQEHPQYIDVVYMSTGEVLTNSDLNNYGLSLNVSWNTDDFKNVTGTKTATITLKQINNNYIFLDADGVEISYPWIYTTTCSFEITPSILQLEAEDCTKIAGTADPNLTFHIKSGLVEGEVPGYSGHITRDPGETPGTYGITQGNLQLTDNPEGNFLASNYTMYFVSGSFLIQSAPTPGPDPDVPTP